MTENPDIIPYGPPPKAIGIESNLTRAVPIDRVVVDGQRRSLDETKVAELMVSFKQIGLLSPIAGVVRRAEDGEETVRLVAGLHRLEAMKRLGISTIECTLLECDDTLRLELAEIDENILRNNPSPAEHALLTVRRGEILKRLAEQNSTVSQFATASKQAQRQAGQKSGPDVASVRDQAVRTGESKDKIHRSMRRGRFLGPILDKVRGTALDKGAELDALAKLPEAVQRDLAHRAAAGEVVSARTPNREPKPKQKRYRNWTPRQMAAGEFASWSDRYQNLEQLVPVNRQIEDIKEALRKDVDPPSGPGEAGGV